MNPQQQRRSPSVNGGAGQWTVCGILLLATMLNYMDRMALNNMSVRITDELELTQERYGDLEFAFGLAFAAGSLCFGMLADRLSIRWLYPAVVVAWSLVGLLTGLAEGFGQMLACRTMLGFFEAGHWPCALRTTQALLAPERRMFGNSLLQSGGAIGAIVTPLVILALVGTTQAAGAWRLPFLVIGGCGAIWVVAWLVLIGPEPALAGRAGGTAADARGWSAWWEACLGNRRFWALVPFVVGINLTWHLARAWLPKFLQQGRGLSEMQSLLFNSGYYVAADVGCIAAGAAGVWLARSGMSQFGARSLVATACSVSVGLATMAAVSAQGTWMYAALLVVGAGALGLFPCYYSLAQDVSPRHTGKATGLLAAVGWIVCSPFQKEFGKLIDRTGSFDLGFTLAAWVPAIAVVAFLAIWPRERRPAALGGRTDETG
jgi:MFS family permease